jgi:hypothetical protein
MKKISIVLVLVLCVTTLNLAFAGNTKPSNDTTSTNTTPFRPRFQR